MATRFYGRLGGQSFEIAILIESVLTLMNSTVNGAKVADTLAQ
jgi:hypothetical protein